MDSLSHAVLTRFNNLLFSLRATDKLQIFKTNLLKHIFQTISFFICLFLSMVVLSFFLSHYEKNPPG